MASKSVHPQHEDIHLPHIYSYQSLYIIDIQSSKKLHLVVLNGRLGLSPSVLTF